MYLNNGWGPKGYAGVPAFTMVSLPPGAIVMPNSGFCNPHHGFAYGPHLQYGPCGFPAMHGPLPAMPQAGATGTLEGYYPSSFRRSGSYSSMATPRGPGFVNGSKQLQGTEAEADTFSADSGISASGATPLQNTLMRWGSQQTLTPMQLPWQQQWRVSEARTPGPDKAEHTNCTANGMPELTPMPQQYCQQQQQQQSMAQRGMQPWGSMGNITYFQQQQQQQQQQMSLPRSGSTLSTSGYDEGTGLPPSGTTSLTRTASNGSINSSYTAGGDARASDLGKQPDLKGQRTFSSLRRLNRKVSFQGVKPTEEELAKQRGAAENNKMEAELQQIRQQQQQQQQQPYLSRQQFSFCKPYNGDGAGGRTGASGSTNGLASAQSSTSFFDDIPANRPESGGSFYANATTSGNQQPSQQRTLPMRQYSMSDFY